MTPSSSHQKIPMPEQSFSMAQCQHLLNISLYHLQKREFFRLHIDGKYLDNKDNMEWIDNHLQTRKQRTQIPFFPSDKMLSVH